MSDIHDLWNADPFNPHGRPDLDIKHRYPEWVQDTDGVIWELSMTYYQINLDDPETRVLAVRYTSEEATPFVVEQHILSRDFPKVEDYQYVKKRLEELQQMVEEKVNIRRAKPHMAVPGQRKGNA